MTDASARILAEINEAILTHGNWRLINMAGSPNIHIAVMSEPFLSHVLSGKKTVESRFSLKKIAPYGKAEPGDIVFMKAGPIVGCFIVSWVKTFDLRKYPIAEIAKEYSDAICANDAFWESKSSKHYATLLGIEDVKLLSKVSITKSDRRAWLVLV